jgi:hypothetical protein
MKRNGNKAFILLAFGLAGGAFTAFAESPEDTNRRILKDAVVGAVTGAVATEASKDERTSEVAPTGAFQETPSGKDKKLHPHGKDEKRNKKKGWGWRKRQGHRPPGWDRGEKTGWGDSDIPPGLARKKDD